MGSETVLRSIIKSLCWRITGFFILGALSYLIVGKWSESLAIASWFTLIRFVLYVFYERAWLLIKWGKKNMKLKARTYWFTGQPCSGKTVLAKRLVEHLDPVPAIQIDGDDIREIFDNTNYSEAGRRKNIELAQNIAKFLNTKGINAAVSLVSPYKDQRDYFKKKMMLLKYFFTNFSVPSTSISFVTGLNLIRELSFM